MNQLILGDNLEIMRNMESESIDLIYLDPPFFSNRSYEIIWGDKGEIRSFEDRWAGGIEHYINWLKERVQEMHRLLKPTGSILLHCDYHANAQIKVYILDKIFLEKNFRNEIIWYYNRWTNVSNQFQNMHDTIYWYSKNDSSYTFHKNGKKPSESQLKKFEKGWDQNVVKDSKGNKITQYIVYDLEKFKLKCKPKTDARIVYRLTNELKVAPSDIIEIPIINSQANERIGYPTQKPESLLDILIYTLSNEGDVVLDPFVGGGTTIVVAEKLKRSWIGIDQSVAAIKVSEMRMDKLIFSEYNFIGNFYSSPYTLTLHKYDYDTLRYKDAFEFETWIINKFGDKYSLGVIPQNKRGADKGFDGKTRQGTPIQVKRSENIGVNVVKNFYSSCISNDPQGTEQRKLNAEPIGYIIAFSFGSGAIHEVAKFKLQQGVEIKLLRVDEIVDIAYRPKISIKFNDLGTDDKGLRNIAFIVTGESEAGIEFYSFDFNYNDVSRIFSAEQMINKEGTTSYKFKPGVHTIAVKVVDNNGLDAIEIVKIKINGVIQLESI